MSNITLDSTSFSEQLGLYDFFNVLVSGFVFILGVSAINSGIMSLLWGDVTVPKGLFIVAMCYIAGLLMQELGSFTDSKIFKFYHKATRNILKSGLDENNEKTPHNEIIKNPILWKHYRNLADAVVTKPMSEYDDRYECDDVNGFVFSVFQYYINANGKDKKIEKMRALFSMSKTLMSCFGVLAVLTLLELIFDVNMPIKIWDVIGLPELSCTECIDKVLLSLAFSGIAVVFYFRTKKTMRRFLLILLGTYDAIIRSKKEMDIGKL